jgi:hypothetical protein
MPLPKNSEIPLYYQVPSQPDATRLTVPLRERVLSAIANDYLKGKIDYTLAQNLRRRFSNFRLTLSDPPGNREIWGVDHPALQSLEDK